jgi:hypothetical protein
MACFTRFSAPSRRLAIRKREALNIDPETTELGMVLHDVSIHRSHESFWASPASKPMIGQDGLQMKDRNNGKLLWNPIVSFKDKHTRERFSTAVIEALRGPYPEVFADEKESAE